MAEPLDNYLRTYRKKAGYSLEELGFLLGHESGSSAGKHERFDRHPTVRSAMAYNIVFRQPPEKLFWGLYAHVERETVQRALQLSKELGPKSNDPRVQQKLESLRAIYLPITHSKRS